MNFKAWLKRISAIILAACLFLPMSQCSSWVKSEDVVDAKGNIVPAAIDWVDLSPLYVYGEENISLVFLVLLFVWPIFFQLAAYKWQDLNKKYPFLISELLLLTTTSYFVGQIIVAGQRIAYGAYVFILSATIYLVITVIYLRQKIALTTQSR